MNVNGEANVSNNGSVASNASSFNMPPIFPELTRALQDMDTAEVNKDSMLADLGEYGNEGAARDSIENEYQDKLVEIQEKAETLLNAMGGGRRRRHGKSRKHRKSRKSKRKSRKTRRR